MDSKIAEMLQNLGDMFKHPFIYNDATDKKLDKTRGEGDYFLFEIDLSTARTDKEFLYSGDRILVETVEDAVTIKLNSKKNSSIDLQKIEEIKGPFKRIYVTNSASAGNSVNLLVGSGGMFQAKKKMNKFFDNEKLYFGNDDDYYFYFDGTDFVIDSGTHEIKINLGTANTGKIYLGATSGDDGHIYGNKADAFPVLKLDGGKLLLYYSANESVIFGHTGNDIYTFKSTNSTWDYDAVTGTVFRVKKRAGGTTTGNLIGQDIDVVTNLTMGVNFGATGLKVSVKAPNGTGKSYGIDFSSGDASITALFDVGTLGGAITNPGTLSAQVPVEYNGTVYYMYLYTTGS